jgi:hypothetical protein
MRLKPFLSFSGIGVAFAVTSLAVFAPLSSASTPKYLIPTDASTPPAVCAPVITECSGTGWINVVQWSSVTGAVKVVHFHPVGQPTVLATAGWFKSSEVTVGLYLGIKGPGGVPASVSRGPQAVPSSGRSRLLATFNSGFYEGDCHAGFYTNNHIYFPFHNGLATFVRYNDGTYDVMSWTNGNVIPDNVLMARQNLTLMVNAGSVTKATANNNLWGWTYKGFAAVWRSAIGVDANGNFVFVSAPNQTSKTLASLLTQLNLVRAMQLDINPAWPILATYRGPGALGPILQNGNHDQVADRFLTPGTKDFFAAFATQTMGEAQPW